MKMRPIYLVKKDMIKELVSIVMLKYCAEEFLLGRHSLAMWNMAPK